MSSRSTLYAYLAAIAYRKLCQTGGFSLNRLGHTPPNTGYMYSRPNGLVVGLDCNVHDINQFMGDNPAPLLDTDIYWGGWTDWETNLTHLDVSDWTPHASLAWNQGIRNSQIAIWDCETKQSVFLPQSQGHTGIGGVQSHSIGPIYPYAIVALSHCGEGAYYITSPSGERSPDFPFTIDPISQRKAYLLAERWAMVRRHDL